MKFVIPVLSLLVLSACPYKFPGVRGQPSFRTSPSKVWVQWPAGLSEPRQQHLETWIAWVGDFWAKKGFKLPDWSQYGIQFIDSEFFKIVCTGGEYCTNGIMNAEEAQYTWGVKVSTKRDMVGDPSYQYWEARVKHGLSHLVLAVSGRFPKSPAHKVYETHHKFFAENKLSIAIQKSLAQEPER